ncbi:MAG: glycosyltransferase [Saprospiraceae bacterium]|nr:glycosyltransferase [Saprospiraceae bacterium]MBK6815345.1 glycosyltransferase [Saprospiraceae bacterium]MBK8510743.1 glycosyltransferase [Saprospiraceae bacterium]MBK8778643.1 glycosyltransferase [Saprospiraceae bacterium]MBK9677703.1 glycosyltransferase [Saprospiraceae bacterium]
MFSPLGGYGLKNRGSKSKATDFMPVSLFIIVKNEKENLDVLMPLLLNQVYEGSFDIHLVDDQSTDGTQEAIQTWQSLYPKKIFLHTLQHDQAGGKKKAFLFGLEQSTQDLLLMTDADCRPASVHWIQKMVLALGTEDGFVLGYSPYMPLKNHIQGLIQLETSYTALLYLGLAVRNIGYMGVGRNLLYRKKVLVTSQTLTAYQHVLSGDDDLTINELSTNNNIGIQLDPDSFVYSIPKPNWGQWLQQKSRHVSTARYYRPLHQLLLVCFYSTFILSWALPILMYWFWPPILLVFLFSKLVYYIVFKSIVKNILKQDWSVVGWLIAEAKYAVSLIYLTPSVLYKKVKKW